MEDPLHGFYWNEGNGNLSALLKGSFLQLLAFDPNGHPKLIGTAFIIGTEGKLSVAATAAHNFEEVKRLQKPNLRHHATTPPEFLPNIEEIEVNPKKLRAIFSSDGHVDLCNINYAIWDQSTDFAYFTFSPQFPKTTNRLLKEMTIKKVSPKVGDLVGLLGFRGMATSPLFRQGKTQGFQTKGDLVCRIGSVTEIHGEGHILCRSPCLETSIPVFNGMSGGPAFLVPKANHPIVPFGLISTENETSEEKNNKEIPGTSIISLLNPTFPSGKENQIIFDLIKAKTAGDYTTQ